MRRTRPVSAPLQPAHSSHSLQSSQPLQPSQSAQPSQPSPPPSQMRRVRLSDAALAARRAALQTEKRLARQHAPRWYERLLVWLLKLPLTFQRGWWDTQATMAAMIADRPALRRLAAREKARVSRLARWAFGRSRWGRWGRWGERTAFAADWPQDGDVWALQVAELLRAAGVRVEVQRDRWGGQHYTARDLVSDETRATLGALTNPTLDTVLDGHLARERDASTWPEMAATVPSFPIPQPDMPGALAWYTGPLARLGEVPVTPLTTTPRVPKATDSRTAYDPAV
jgi:hypothetical protein